MSDKQIVYLCTFGYDSELTLFSSEEKAEEFIASQPEVLREFWQITEMEVR